MKSGNAEQRLVDNEIVPQKLEPMAAHERSKAGCRSPAKAGKLSVENTRSVDQAKRKAPSQNIETENAAKKMGPNRCNGARTTSVGIEVSVAKEIELFSPYLILQTYS